MKLTRLGGLGRNYSFHPPSPPLSPTLILTLGRWNNGARNVQHPEYLYIYINFSFMRKSWASFRPYFQYILILDFEGGDLYQHLHAPVCAIQSRRGFAVSSETERPTDSAAPLSRSQTTHSTRQPREIKSLVVLPSSIAHPSRFPSACWQTVFFEGDGTCLSLLP